MKLLLVFITLSMACAAQAKIAGLPRQLRGGEEQNIQEASLEGIAEMNNCEFSDADWNTLNPHFALVGGELQSEEYAEYKGELATLEVGVTLNLPATCKKAGKTSCQLRFSLYDERSYSLSREHSKCE